MLPITSRAKQIIDRISQYDNLAHAYLFNGLPGAFLDNHVAYFIARLRCIAPNNELCGQCIYCQQINKANWPDYLELKTEKSFNVEIVRELQSKIKYGPLNQKYLFVIISKIETFTPQAANAFLKTLEEPPEKVIFILTTNNLTEVMPTLISRCQIFDFPNFTQQQYQELFNNLPNQEQERLTILVKANSDFLNLILEDPKIENLNYISFKQFTALDLLERLNLANQLASDKLQASAVLILWLKEICQNFNSLYKNQNVEKIIANLTKMKYNLNLKIHLEALFLQL